jgi:predicted NBD/HSP70 family sugar kinase
VVGVTAYGLDVGATKTLGVVVADDGTVLASVRQPTDPGPRGVLATAGRVVDQLRRESGAVPHGPVGVGVPGLVVGGAMRHAVNLEVGGDALRLQSLLSEHLGHEVLLENDSNVAALGAAQLIGASDLAYLSIGTGLSAGLVLDGRLRRGGLGAAGEIGHIPVDPAGEPCSCGQRGCLETTASGAALARMWPTTNGLPVAQDVFARAAEGDAKAAAVRAVFADGVAAAARLLMLSVDVECVVLGGGVAALGEPLRQAVQGALDAQSDSSPFLASLDLAERVRVLDSGHPVAAIGAAQLGTLGG